MVINMTSLSIKIKFYPKRNIQTHLVTVGFLVVHLVVQRVVHRVVLRVVHLVVLLVVVGGDVVVGVVVVGVVVVVDCLGLQVW